MKRQLFQCLANACTSHVALAQTDWSGFGAANKTGQVVDAVQGRPVLVEEVVEVRMLAAAQIGWASW